MKFNPPLLESKLIRRYNRFLSEHILQNGNKVIAHCPNPGSMLGLIQKGSKTWLSIAKNKKRKLKYTWELINADKTMVGINTLLSNKIEKEELIKKSLISNLDKFTGYDLIDLEQFRAVYSDNLKSIRPASGFKIIGIDSLKMIQLMYELSENKMYIKTEDFIKCKCIYVNF